MNSMRLVNSVYAEQLLSTLSLPAKSIQCNFYLVTKTRISMIFKNVESYFLNLLKGIYKLQFFLVNYYLSSYTINSYGLISKKRLFVV